jgi:hypothetical protein
LIRNGGGQEIADFPVENVFDGGDELGGVGGMHGQVFAVAPVGEDQVGDGVDERLVADFALAQGVERPPGFRVHGRRRRIRRSDFLCFMGACPEGLGVVQSVDPRRW